MQASHLTGQTQIWAKPKPLYKQKEQTRKTKTKDIFNEYFRIRKPNGELDIEKEYLRRKAIITFVKKTFWNKTQKQAVLFQKPNDFLK